MDFEETVRDLIPLHSAVQIAQIANLPLPKEEIEKILTEDQQPTPIKRFKIETIFEALCKLDYQPEYVQRLQKHPEFSLLKTIPTSVLDVFEVHWKNGVGRSCGGAPYAKLLDLVSRLRHQCHTYANWTALIKASFPKDLFSDELYRYACCTLLAIHVGDASNSWELFQKGLSLSLYFAQPLFPESNSNPLEFTRLCLARVCMHINTLVEPHCLRLEQMWYQLCLYTGCKNAKWTYCYQLTWDRIV